MCCQKPARQKSIDLQGLRAALLWLGLCGVNLWIIMSRSVLRWTAVVTLLLVCVDMTIPNKIMIRIYYPNPKCKDWRKLFLFYMVSIEYRFLCLLVFVCKFLSVNVGLAIFFYHLSFIKYNYSIYCKSNKNTEMNTVLYVPGLLPHCWLPSYSYSVTH